MMILLLSILSLEAIMSFSLTAMKSKKWIRTQNCNILDLRAFSDDDELHNSDCDDE